MVAVLMTVLGVMSLVICNNDLCSKAMGGNENFNIKDSGNDNRK